MPRFFKSDFFKAIIVSIIFLIFAFNINSLAKTTLIPDSYNIKYAFILFFDYLLFPYKLVSVLTSPHCSWICILDFSAVFGFIAQVIVTVGITYFVFRLATDLHRGTKIALLVLGVVLLAGFGITYLMVNGVQENCIDQYKDRVKYYSQTERKKNFTFSDDYIPGSGKLILYRETGDNTTAEKYMELFSAYGVTNVTKTSSGAFVLDVQKDTEFEVVCKIPPNIFEIEPQAY